MKERSVHEDHNILAAAERQMHAWALTAELGDRAIRHDAESRSAKPAVQCVAISREAGAGGEAIARELGRRLAWDVFDKNLLDCIAQRFRLSRMMLDLVDETPCNWVYDVLGTWMDRRIVTHEKFFSHLCRVVLAAAQHGHAVFVGRGAQFLLPPAQRLAVRLVASPKYRVQQIIALTGLKERAALRMMSEVDHGRREFVERFFHRDVTDSHNYDLVINVERCGQDSAVAEVLAALGVHAP
jgi:hypothetical protein